MVDTTSPSQEQLDKETKAVYEEIHRVGDCILKHLFTVPIYVHETIQATQEKGLPVDELVNAYDKSVELSRKTLSQLLPSKDCATKTMHELWGAIGWLNGAEHHMEQKYAEFTEVNTEKQRVLKANIPKELNDFVMALPVLMQATRGLRRDLERYSFKDIANALIEEKYQQPMLP